MNQGEVLSAIRRAVNAAQDALISNNDDAWHAAMHEIRERAWFGKELIHSKRLAEAEAKGINVFGNARTPPSRTSATQPRRAALDVSTLEDILNANHNHSA